MFRSHIGAFALAAALVMPLAASAQTVPAGAANPAPPAAAPAASGHHRHHHGNRYMHALRGLQLSDAQKSQIRDMMKQAHAANAPSGTKVDKATRRANMVALRQQIDGVLTDTQRAELHAKLKASRHGAKAGETAPQAPPAQ